MPALSQDSTQTTLANPKAMLSSNSAEGGHPLKSVAEGENGNSAQQAMNLKQFLSEEQKRRSDRGICEKLAADLSSGLNTANTTSPADLDEMCNNALRVQVEYHDEPRAIELYEEVVKLEANHIRALSCLGALYHKSGRLDEARKCYDKVLAMEPDRYKTVYNLGRLAHDVGSYDDAQKCYQRALALKCDDTIACNALAFLGLLHQDVHRDFEQAQKCYESALQRNPIHLRTLDHQCALMVLMGNREAARIQHARIVKQDPGHSDHMCAYLNSLFNGELLNVPLQRCCHAAGMDHNSWHGSVSSLSTHSQARMVAPAPVQKSKSHSFLNKVASKIKDMAHRRDSGDVTGARMRVGSFPYKSTSSKVVVDSKLDNTVHGAFPASVPLDASTRSLPNFDR